ncbi:hypothetical protein [Solimonas soli]|uniref:hypothetical protein n=1 Tax=Solimonas soli TaxID=413479 RepID=UPI00048A0ECC|nr:hypothetical protein [Solimonas soli]
MLGALRDSWRFLRSAPAGERFSRYHARRREGRRHAWAGALRLAGGVLTVALGIVLMPAPGPGTLIAAAGAALIAGESRGFAAFLDRLELRLRVLFGRRSA